MQPSFQFIKTHYNYSMAEHYIMVFDQPKNYENNSDTGDQVHYANWDEHFINLFGAYYYAILDIDSDSKAKEFINRSLNYISKLDLLKYYNGLTNQTINNYKKTIVRHSTQLGGNLGPDTEPHIYKMLLLMDTIHDFKDIAECKEYLDEFIEKHLVDMPYLIENGVKSKWQDMLIRNEEECIRKLSKINTLEFIDGFTIDNPFYNIDISSFSLYKLSQEVTSITYKELVERSINSTAHKLQTNKTFSTDLYGYGNNPNLLKIEYNQLYRLIGIIDRLFSSGQETLHFQVDCTASPFSRLFFSLSYINNNINELFELDQQLQQYIIDNQLEEKKNKNWIFRFSDTNISDPGDIKTLVKANNDNRPTGNIYNARVVPYQVFLDGIQYNIPPNHKQPGQIKPTTNITIKDLSLEKTFTIDNANSGAFSGENITRILGVEGDKYPLNPKQYSFLNNFTKYNAETLFALKRAGDWGQVEHAKKYNKVFVTGDRYAALYAYFRKVPTLFIRTKFSLKPYEYLIYDRTRFPNVCQLSFIIFNPNLY